MINWRPEAAAWRAGHVVRGGFFGAAWLTGAVALIVVGLLVRSPAALLIGILTLLTAGVARYWALWTLRALQVEIGLSTERALPDDVVTLTVQVRNAKPVPIPWMVIEIELSDGLRVADRPTLASGESGRQRVRFAAGFRPFERRRWQTTLHCPVRGRHPIGPTELRAGDVFGFFIDRISHPSSLAMLVYPRTAPLGQLGLAPQLPLGETRVAEQLHLDPTRVIGVRDYRPEDPMRMVHWKATARRGALQTRVIEPSRSLRLTIALNLDTFDHYWEGLDIAESEAMIVLASSLATWADGARVGLGLCANGLLPGTDRALRIPNGRGLDHLARVLGGLAQITPYATMPFATVLQSEAALTPAGTTLVVISAQMPEQLATTLADMCASGQAVMFLPIGRCPVPAIQGLHVQRVDLSALSSPPPVEGQTA